jgi:hypothetical protein
MRSFRPPQGSSPPAALPALLRAAHLLGLALGSALGRLRNSGVTAARMFERAEESALLLRMMREAALQIPWMQGLRATVFPISSDAWESSRQQAFWNRAPCLADDRTSSSAWDCSSLALDPFSVPQNEV